MKTKRVMSYFGHVIYKDGFGYFMFAKGDGTDYIFDNIYDCMLKIELIEGYNRTEFHKD